MAGLEELGKALGFGGDHANGEWHCYGTVKSATVDGTAAVRLSGASEDTPTVMLCDAAQGDRVLCVVLASGRCAAVGRVGGDMTPAWGGVEGKPFETISDEMFAVSDGRLSWATHTGTAAAASGWTLSANQLVRRNGFVSLKINCSRTSSTISLGDTASEVATIPSGFRPRNAFNVLVPGSSGRNALCEILADGTVRLSHGTYPGQASYTNATTSVSFWINATYAV